MAGGVAWRGLDLLGVSSEQRLDSRVAIVGRIKRCCATPLTLHHGRGGGGGGDFSAPPGLSRWHLGTRDAPWRPCTTEDSAATARSVGHQGGYGCVAGLPTSDLTGANG